MYQWTGKDFGSKSASGVEVRGWEVGGGVGVGWRGWEGERRLTAGDVEGGIWGWWAG